MGDITQAIGPPAGLAADLDNHLRDIEWLQALFPSLTQLQWIYVATRLHTRTDKDACKEAGIPRSTVSLWRNKKDVDAAVKLLSVGEAVMAAEVRHRALRLRNQALPEAMRVKVAGLRSKSERIRQGVATEISEWELGKAVQRTEVTGVGGGALRVEFISILNRAYGDNDDNSDNGDSDGAGSS